MWSNIPHMCAAASYHNFLKTSILYVGISLINFLQQRNILNKSYDVYLPMNAQYLILIICFCFYSFIYSKAEIYFVVHFPSNVFIRIFFFRIYTLRSSQPWQESIEKFTRTNSNKWTQIRIKIYIYMFRQQCTNILF